MTSVTARKPAPGKALGPAKVAFSPVYLGMSRLRRADYAQHLKGKTIVRCDWTNDETEHYHCLCIFFSDDTMVRFRLYQHLEEEVELQDFIGGNISHQRLLTPLPIGTKRKDGE